MDENGLPFSSSSYTGPTRRTSVTDVYADGVPTYDDPGTRVGKPGF